MIFNEAFKPLAALDQAEHYIPNSEGRASSNPVTLMEDVGIFLSSCPNNINFPLLS
jgi:hypothetical protein